MNQAFWLVTILAICFYTIGAFVPEESCRLFMIAGVACNLIQVIFIVIGRKYESRKDHAIQTR